MTEPPDKYRTLKIPLERLQYKDNDYTAISNAVFRTHKLTIQVYQFLRAYILYQHSHNIGIIQIDDDVLHMVHKALVKPSCGPKPKGNNNQMFTSFTNFYDIEFKHFVNQNNKDKIDGFNLSVIISYNCIDMLKNIENNIKMNFFTYLKQFVNESLKSSINRSLEKYSGEERTEKRKQFNKELYAIKQDLINNTLLSPERHHGWINKYRNKILPIEYTHSYQHDINLYPQKYMKYMIVMNEFLEKKNLKCFQFFPLRTDIVPKFVQIDTKALIELLVTEEKQKYLSKLTFYQKDLWDTCFNTKHKIFKMKGYTFDHCITTDGLSASIRFLNTKYAEKQITKKENIAKARAATRVLNKDLTQDEIDQNKKDKKAKLC
jgi:hypothetical protein